MDRIDCDSHICHYVYIDTGSKSRAASGYRGSHYDASWRRLFFFYILAEGNVSSRSCESLVHSTQAVRGACMPLQAVA